MKSTVNTERRPSDTEDVPKVACSELPTGGFFERFACGAANSKQIDPSMFRSPRDMSGSVVPRGKARNRRRCSY